MQPPLLFSRSFFALLWGCQLSLFLASAFPAQPGSIDTTFNAHLSDYGAVYVVVAQPDGQLLIGGAFDSVAGVPRANVARLNRDGTLDTSFNPGTAVDIGYVNAIAIDQNGRVVLGGAFISSDYSAPNNLARLNSDGSADYSFDISLYLDGPVNAVAVQGEDYIVVAGAFVYVNGYRRQNVARLRQDGTLDYAFDACVASTAGVGATALALLPDEHILVTGKFTFAGNRSRDGIARLESCGDLDASYAPQPGINTNANVYSLALLTNGHVLLGGDFVLYNGQPAPGLVELDTNGVPYAGFNPGLGVNGATVYALAVETDQKRFIGGSFDLYNQIPTPNLARLGPDGALDSAFTPGSGPDNAISSILLLPNGRRMVAGRFSSYGGVARSGLVRLHGDLVAGRLGQPSRLFGGEWGFEFQGEEGMQYTIESSSNLVDWNTLVSFIAPAGAYPVIDPAKNEIPFLFYRAVSAR